MLERKEYNKKLDKVRQEQISEIADYLKKYIKLNANMRDEPIFGEDEEAFARISAMEIPRKGRDFKEVADELVNDVLSNCVKLQHPRYMSLVSSSVSPYSVGAAILTDIYNPNIAGWDLAPGVGAIEEKLIKWMGSRAGFSEKCGGVFTSGGSVSNLTGIIAARENMLPGRLDLAYGAAFCSDQSHSSIVKGLKLSGLREDQIFVIESDDKFKIRLDLLEEKILEAKAKGLKPYLMVGNLASTNTGAIDPFDEMSELAKKYNMWLHADGAYGGSILFSDIYCHLAKGIEKVDSLSWDTHKWGMQAYSCSCIIARDKQTFINAFHEHPEYLADVTNAKHNDGWDLGIEMSRPARCLKLWATIQGMGTDCLADVIDYSFYNSQLAYKMFRDYPDWTIISKPMCGALNVRYEPEGIDSSKYDEINAEIAKTITIEGFAYVLNTTLKGKKVVRFITINGNTETEDVVNVVERLNQIAVSIKEELLKK